MDGRDRDVLEDTGARDSRAGAELSVVPNLIHPPSPYRSLVLSP